MEWLLNFLDSYQAAITAIATIVIAVSAVVTTILTRKLARENELLRKAGTEPEVIAYLESGFHSGFTNFVLANVGRGPARNVKFRMQSDDPRLSGDEDSARRKGIFLRNIHERTAISFIPPGESVRALFGASRRLVQEPKLPPFEVSIEYENMKGKRYTGTAKLDISQFLGLLPETISPSEREIVKALERIEQHLGDVSKNVSSVLSNDLGGFSGIHRLKVETITTQEKEARRERKRQRDRMERETEKPSDHSAESGDST